VSRPRKFLTQALAAPRWTVFVALHLTGLLVLLLYIAARTPIVALDFDLWYHLGHGRYIIANGELPTTSYFSFLTPSRAWVDYYWLFQVLVYSVFEQAGYYGLLVVRTSLLCGYLLAVGGYLLRGTRSRPELLWLAFLFGLYASHGINRYMNLRPHTISYLILPLILLLIEMGSRWVYLVPPLALVWVNFHGIEYPVLVLVAVACLTELLILGRRCEAGLDADQQRLALVLIAAMTTIFLTPHGLRLLRVPFRSIEYAAHYIQELQSKPWVEYFTYDFSLQGWTLWTTSNLLLLLTLLALASGIFRGELRWSHLLMVAGGLFLLFKAMRFTHEFSLLALPLLKAQVPPPLAWEGKRGRRLGACVAVLGLAVPWLYLLPHLPDRQLTYPLTLQNVPHGAVHFMDSVDAPGTVLNPPNFGGYLLWTLPPKSYRIAADMETPFLFLDEDIFQVTSAFYDAAALRHFLERYQPTWIAAAKRAKGFPGLIAAHPDYRMVFVDDEILLYLDAGAYPEIAARNVFETGNPFALAQQRFSELGEPQRRALRRDLERIVAVDADVSWAQQTLAVLANMEGDPERARGHIAQVLKKSPRLGHAHVVLADVLTAAGDPEEAVASYRRALRWSEDDGQKQEVQRSLSVVLSGLGRYEEALEALHQPVETFNFYTSYRDLYHLSQLAAASGQLDAARKALRFAAWKVPHEDVLWQQRIAEELKRLGGEEEGPPG
jgi:Tfp pilus assembly protein PilF